MADSRYIPPDFSAAESFDWFNLYYSGFDMSGAMKLLNNFNIDPALKIKNYSKGMVARLYLILMISARFELLMLDEPFSNLDAIVRDDILNLLRDYASTGEKTIIITSHECNDLESICDSIMFLNGSVISFNENLESLKCRCKKIIFKISQSDPEFNGYTANGKLNIIQRGKNYITAYTDKFDETMEAALAELFSACEIIPLTLQEIFKFEGMINNERKNKIL